ncbi:hypothetical protein [Nocardia alni]|uniref:hypothetical protein n=1 Tax=Nocardia alni TaxID=2815723 RepID=UPI001C2349FD|nr:hypothetical protein [Nocardia alni]
MSVRTRVDSPRTRTTAKPPRRVHDPENVRSGAAKRAYARRRNRVEGGGPARPPAPGRASSVVSGRIPFVVAIIVLLGCGLMGTLLLTTRAAEDSYQLSDARRVNQRLTDEQAELQRQVAAADSAPELASRARELGMIPAKDPARLLVAPDGTVTVVGKETAQEGPPAPPLNTSPADPVPPPPNLTQAHGERLVPVNPVPNQNPADQAAQRNSSGPGAAQAASAQPGAAQANPAQPTGTAQAPQTPVLAQSPAAPAPAPAAAPVAPTPLAPAAQSTVPAPAPQAPAAAPAADLRNQAAPAPRVPISAAPVDRPVAQQNSAPAPAVPTAVAPGSAHAAPVAGNPAPQAAAAAVDRSVPQQGTAPAPVVPMPGRATPPQSLAPQPAGGGQ